MAGNGQPPSQYLFQFESSDISRLRADVQSLGFVSLVRCAWAAHWFEGCSEWCFLFLLLFFYFFYREIPIDVRPSTCVLCSPGGMVRLAHAVIKHFLLAFKVCVAQPCWKGCAKCDHVRGSPSFEAIKATQCMGSYPAALLPCAVHTTSPRCAVPWPVCRA